MQTPSIVAFSPPAPQRSVLGIALVGTLHAAAIYTLLVALDIAPAPPFVPKPAQVKIIDQLPRPTREAQTNLQTVTLSRPPESAVSEPVIRIAPPSSGPDVIGGGNQVDLVVLSGTSVPVRAIADTHTLPPYPPLAIRLGREGNVRLKIAVDEQGRVTSADVEESSGHRELDAAAVAWVKAHWRYEPAVANGSAVASTTEAVVTFKLTQVRG